MGEAKRRKQFLGEQYGNVTDSIKIAKKINDAKLPSSFLPDLGLEIAAQIGQAPFKLTVLSMDSYTFIVDQGRSITCVSFNPREIVLKAIDGSQTTPLLMRKTTGTIEIATVEKENSEKLLSALKSGLDVKANWEKRFFSRNPAMKELILPIHLLPYEETKLGFRNISSMVI
ncbi:MAG: DUF2839 domain-containing protein [Scytonematopsis contorta HA4267-MV1]|jgi:hypothetical protein|nr:DUF2839 domain-containing protein [Scytonematopsis contorta HA4267-MV1]